MVDFNGFDKGVIGKKLPADTTLNCMRKSELINLLHLAEENHRVLAEAYKIAVDTSKCNICPLHLDNRKVEDIREDERKKMLEWITNTNHITCDEGEWYIHDTEAQKWHHIDADEILELYSEQMEGEQT